MGKGLKWGEEIYKIIKCWQIIYSPQQSKKHKLKQKAAMLYCRDSQISAGKHPYWWGFEDSGSSSAKLVWLWPGAVCPVLGSHHSPILSGSAPLQLLRHEAPAHVGAGSG